MIKVLIVDDHQIIIDGIKALLSDEEDIAVIGEALSGKEALKILDTTPEIDVVIMDIKMPQMDGIKVTEHVKKKYNSVNILILTMHDNPEYIESLINAGASGYILKNTGKQELINALKAIAKGEQFFGAEVTKSLISGIKKKNREPLIELTPREKEVLKWIADELTTEEIADRMCLSHHTVESHRKNLLSKTGAHNTIGLVKYGIKVGLIRFGQD